MPRNKTALAPAEYAVLGLVRKKPAYGYELQRLLGGRSGLARVCPVEPAMVYAILKSLSGLELIDGEWDNSSYPPKAVYSATDQGEIAFQRWLRSPVARMREVRLDFMAKLYFAMDEGRDLCRDLVTEQIEICHRYAEGIASELAEADPHSFDAVALGSKLSAARITEQWLGDYLGALKGSAETT
jgi:PadR family transcriptional regulator AphA